MAMMITGTIIGEMRKALTSRFSGNRPRARAKAARVPSTVASTVVRSATWTLSTVASRHCSRKR